MPTEHTSRNLPALLDGILPTGGLQILDDGDINPLGEYDYQAENIFARLNITTTKQLISATLLVHSLQDYRSSGYLLAEGMKRGLLSKQDLATMYLWQSESVRLYSPLLTLDNLWQIPHRAFPRAHDDTTPLSAGFTREDIIALAERVQEIAHSDLTMFFQQWFYRSEKPFPFSKEFMLRYYKNKERREIDGKIESLIAIALSYTYPEELKFEEIKEKMLELARHDPDSHGIYRYLGLIFWVAGNNQKKRKLAIAAYTELVITMVNKSLRYFPGPSFAVEMFMEEPGIPAEEKIEGLKAINGALREKAKVYLEIARTVRKELRKVESSQRDLF